MLQLLVKNILLVEGSYDTFIWSYILLLESKAY